MVGKLKSRRVTERIQILGEWFDVPARVASRMEATSDELQQLQRENERLRHYITRIGHRCECSVWLTPKPGESGVKACDCGYEQALKGGE